MPQKQSLRTRKAKLPEVNPVSIGCALAAADHLSFRGAGRELGIRHASVIRRVGAFEDALGILLFDRGYRGLRLTNPDLSTFFRPETLFNSFIVLSEPRRRRGAARRVI
jgi:hypothetical protein